MKSDLTTTDRFLTRLDRVTRAVDLAQRVDRLLESCCPAHDRRHWNEFEVAYREAGTHDPFWDDYFAQHEEWESTTVHGGAAVGCAYRSETSLLHLRLCETAVVHLFSAAPGDHHWDLEVLYDPPDDIYVPYAEPPVTRRDAVHYGAAT